MNDDISRPRPEIKQTRYCRREIGGAFCAKPITVKNAHDWCEDCRAEHMPFWPE